MEVRAAMERGSMNQLDDRIVNVTFVEDDADSRMNKSTTIVQGSDTFNGAYEPPVIPIYAWAIIGLTFILLVLVFALVIRRRRFAKDPITDDYEYDDVSLEEYYT